MKRRRWWLPLAVSAFSLAGCGQAMSALSGASPMGPLWLSLLVGTIELLVIALAIVVAVIPVGADPGDANRTEP